MKVAITGTSGLARVIKDKLEGQDIKVSTPRVEDLTMNGTNWWGFDYDNSMRIPITLPPASSISWETVLDSTDHALFSSFW